MLTSLIISNVLLWSLLLAMTCVVLALVRQIGVLNERIAPAGALMLGSGPKTGEVAPIVSVTDISGQAHRIGGKRSESRSLLLFFLSPNCPVCKTLLPVLKSVSKSEGGWLDIILASDGESAEHQNLICKQRLEQFTYVLSADLGLAYRVSKLPYAVLIDADGIIRSGGLVNSREHLESLFEASERGVDSVQAFIANSRKEEVA